MGVRMRRVALVALTLAAIAAGCLDPAPPASDPTCEAGVANARARLGARATAPVACAYTDLPVGGYYEGYVGPNRAWVYFGPHASTTAWGYEARAVHEEGHAWDRNRLTDAKRARFAAIVGYPWHVERYADVFMLVLTGSPGPGAYGTPAPSPGQRAALCGETIVPC